MNKVSKIILGSVGLMSIATAINFADLSMVQLAQTTSSSADGTQSSVNWLLILVSLLIGGILVLIFDITNLTSKVIGKKILNWNKINAWLFIVFMVVGLGAAFWEFFYHGKYVIMEEATEHSKAMNTMFRATLFFTGLVFVIVQIALFMFSFLYHSKEGRKATYVSHNNKLEIVWTIIPFITMAVLVLMGMKSWSDITKKSDNKPEQIEVFGYQFGWNARYPGDDKLFGEASFNYISGTNPLGLPVDREVDALIDELKEDLKKLINQGNKDTFEANYNALLALNEKEGLTYTEDKKESLDKKIEEIENGVAMEEIKAAIFRKQKQIERIGQIRSADANKLKATGSKMVFNDNTYDDVITNEIHLVLDKEVEFLFRARDVIHSAWIPHFKVQMNVVPGMQTRFRFKPIKTTAQKRKEVADESYDYYLFCNKVCGSAHYNMKIKVVVETQDEYNQWMKTQSPAFVKNPVPVKEKPLETIPSDSMSATPEMAIN